MKLKKARITLFLFIITIIIIISSNLTKPDEKKIVDIVVENEIINEFVQERDVDYNVTLISLGELLELKNSTQYAIYAGLPNKPVYKITVLEGVGGYLAFVDVETNQIVDVIEVYNLQII